MVRALRAVACWAWKDLANRVRVLIDGDIYSMSLGGGTIRYCNQLIRGLTFRGVEVALAVREDAQPRYGGTYPDCRIVRDPGGAPGYDIFHGSYYSDFRRARGAATVVTIHDMIDERLPKHLTQCGSGDGNDDAKSQAIAHADHLVAISETTKRDIVQHYGVPDDRITVIHHGIPGPLSSSDPVPPRNLIERELGLYGPYVLHVGGREGYKNFEFLLEAYARSRARGTATLVAAGSQRHFLPGEERVVERYGLRSEVMLLGYVTDPMLRCLYSHASLLAMPSLYEGFGYPMIEAMALGVTVACSTAPALLEVGQGSPLVFNPTDSVGAARVLDDALMEDHSLRNHLAVRIAKGFSEDRMISEYMRMYESLI